MTYLQAKREKVVKQQELGGTSVNTKGRKERRKKGFAEKGGKLIESREKQGRKRVLKTIRGGGGIGKP